jgi:tripartite-type tricarboxylate transporter receptor subunit TctC
MKCRAWVAAGLLCIASFSAAAQEYPSKPIRLIIPFAAGSIAEVIFRTLALVAEPSLGQRFIIESKPGADGNIGMADAVRSAPDGYTLVLAPTANFAVMAHLHKDLNFDPLVNLDPITVLAETWPLATVGPNVPVKSLKELAELVRANPGKFNYGSQGQGSPTHLIGAAFSQLTGNSMVHIPYKGTPPMMQAMLAGDIQVVFASLGSVLPQLKAGKVRAVAVMGRTRQPELPDLPTAVEAGFPQLVMSNWWVLAAPKGTSPRIVERLHAEMRKALDDPNSRKRLAELAHIPVGMGPAEAPAFLKSESARYGDIIRKGNIRLE